MPAKTAAACTDPAVICWIEAHPGLAGWFQAIGAILALVIALGLPALQGWLRKRHLRHAAFVSASSAVNHLRLFAATAREGVALDADYWKRRAAVAHLINDLLAAVDVHGMGHTGAAHGFNQIRIALRVGFGVLDTVQPAGFTVREIRELGGALTQAEELLADLTKDLRLKPIPIIHPGEGA